MALNYKTLIVTTTPYNVATDDEVIFVNIAGPASVVLPSSGGGDGKRSLYTKTIRVLLKRIQLPLQVQAEKPLMVLLSLSSMVDTVIYRLYMTAQTGRL